jgi:phage terminase small subunit
VEGGTPTLNVNPKQARFCNEYIVDLNGKKAAIRAGYQARSAHVTASRLLADPKVQTKVAELQEALAKRTGITVERVLAEYSKLAFANMQDYITVQQDGLAYLDLSKLTRDQAAAIAHFTVEEESIPLYKDEDDEQDEGIPIRAPRTVKIKLADKKGALDSIAKHLGMFLDKEQSPDRAGIRFAGTLTELLAMYRQMTSKTA